MRRDRQYGGASIGAVIWILLFVGLVMVSKEMIPVKIRTSQLEDFMIELAKFSTREPDERLQKRILEKAEELQLPLVKDDVSVRKSSGRVRMRAPVRDPDRVAVLHLRVALRPQRGSTDLHHLAPRMVFTVRSARFDSGAEDGAAGTSSAPTRSATRGVPLSRR